ncbi:MAG: hypothetical protein ACRBCL_06920 [Maritimibacter sp.]
MLWLNGGEMDGSLYMQHEWIIDVLADLKSFAERKGMSATAAQLDDASLVVLAELTAMQGQAGEGSMVQEHDGETGSVTYLFAGRGYA